MKNLKKLTMLASAAVLAMGLTACGKSDYNGTYTGYQTDVAATAAPGANTQQQYPYQQPYYPGNYSQMGIGGGAGVVQASLSSNGDSVTGTYQVNPTSNVGFGSTTYQLSASTVDSNSLTNVMLMPSGQQNTMGSCARTGSLSSSNGGKSLSGTLNPITQYGSNCGPIQINLTRTN